MFRGNAATVKRESEAFPSVEAFVGAALQVVKQVDSREKRGRDREHELERILAAIWLLCRCGVQWRAIGLMTGLPWTTVYYHFARWTRLGLWRRLAVGLVGMLRVFYGQDPSVGVADTRSVRSTPTAGARGIDGGKKVNGIKLSIVTERWGFPLAMRVTTADVNDRDSLRDMLVELRAEWPSVDKLLADLGYSGQKLNDDAKERGFEMLVKKCGDGSGKFRPTEIRWVVERTFGWLSRWRRTVVCYETPCPND